MVQYFCFVLFSMKSKFVFWAACGAYIGALTMPAIILNYDSGGGLLNISWYGFEILQSGFFGVLTGQYAWFANILLIGGFIMINTEKYVGGMWWFGAAFLIGLQTLMVHSYNLGTGPYSHIVERFAPGFYFWELSFLLFFLYCWLCWKQKPKDGLRINWWIILSMIFLVGLANSILRNYE